jgi:hypothetical protein
MSNVPIVGWRAFVTLRMTEPWSSSPALRERKPAWSNPLQVFDHAGLLVNGPPGTAGLPFV